MNLRGVLILCVLIFTSLLFSGSRYFAGSQAVTQPDSVWQAWKWESVFLLKQDSLEKKFRRLHEEEYFNGVVWIAERGQVMHKGVYGYRDFRTKDTLSFDTAFQLASVSKIFTATAVLLLYQDGLIDVDDEVRKHIPGFPYRDMTIRNLLNHRSGMGRYMAIADTYWTKWRTPMSNEDVLRQYRRYRPATFFRPDNGFNYCNTNYVFLALLVEKVSGIPFDRFMEERIFTPLGMEQAVIYSRVTDPEIPNEATGHKGWEGRFWKAPNDYIDGVVGDKGMYASVPDLVKFDQALYEGKLIRPEVLAEAFTPGSPRRRHNYGFGWRLRRLPDRQLIYHFGWWRGFRSCFIRDVAHQRTIIILSNADIPRHNLNYWEIFDYVSDPDHW